MRLRFIVSLAIMVGVLGGYFYTAGAGVCPIPLQWRIGTLDERFGLEHQEAVAAVEAAATIWEASAGRDLFVYDDQAPFAINFIFDERQAFADAESNFKDRLDTAEGVNDSIEATYAAKVAAYETLQRQYEQASAAYEIALADYNQTVARFNREGGAPPEEYAALQRQQQQLAEEQQALNVQVDQLNAMVAEINSLSDQGNRLIETYNRGVEAYNETFGREREFTQGDYQGDKINIYTFASTHELELVLTHELGHALHLEHVTGSSSVMFYLIGEQPAELTLSPTDQAEFARVCAPRSLWDKIQAGKDLIFNT